MYKKKTDSTPVIHRILCRSRSFFTYFIIMNHMLVTVAQATAPFHEDQSQPRVHPVTANLIRPLPIESIDDTFEKIPAHGFLASIKSLLSRPFTLLSDALIPAKAGFSQSLDSLLSWAYEELKDVVPASGAKSIHEAAFDKDFWQAHYISVIEGVRESGQLSNEHHAHLQELQGLVWNRMLSPYQYVEGLQELKGSHRDERITELQTSLGNELSDYPLFVESAFKQELVKSYSQMISGQSDLQDFKGILNYYNAIVNPVDYKEILQSFKEQLDASMHSYNTSQARSIQKALAAALHVLSPEGYRHEIRKRQKVKAALHELPFRDEDLDERGMWPDVRNVDLTTDKIKKARSAFSYKRMARTVRKGFEYVLHHPVEAATLVLAAQATAVAAFDPLFRRAGSGGQSTSLGEDESVNSPFQLAANGTAGLERAAVTYLSNGNAFMAWQLTGGGDCNGRIWNPANGPVTDPFDFKTVSHQCYTPSLISLDNGNVLAAWTGLGGPIYSRAFNNLGTAISSNQQVSFKGINLNPALVHTDNDRINIAWFSSAAATPVYGNILNGSGNPLLMEEKLLSPSGSDSIFPAIATLSDGNIVAVWHGLRGSGTKLFRRLFDSLWNPLTDEMLIEDANALGPSFTAVAPLSNGNVIVAWEDLGMYYTIYATLFNSTLSPLTPRITVGSSVNGNSVRVRTAVLADDNIFMTWQSNKKGTFDIYGRLFNSNLVPLTNEILINQETSISQYYPALAVSPAGEEIAVVWYDDETKSIWGRFLNNATIAALDAAATSTTSTTGTPGTGPVTSSTSPTSSLTTDSTSASPAVTTAAASGTDVTTGTTGLNPGTTTTGSTTIQPSTITTSPSSTGVPGTSSTTQAATTLLTTGKATTSTMPATGTSGQPVTTGAAATSMTTSFNFNSQENRSEDRLSTGAILGIGMGGGVLLLTLCGAAIWKTAKKNQHKRENSSIEMGRISRNPFAASATGFTDHSTVIGAINNRTYAIWKQLSPQEVEMTQPLTAREIPKIGMPVEFYLGKGAFGATYFGRDLENEQFYAIKEVYGRKAVEESLAEGEILHDMEAGPNVMTLIDYRHFAPRSENEEPRLFQIMPLAYVNGKGYKEFLSTLTNSQQKEALAADSFQQVMKGLSYIHNLGIVHLDIKDENILYKKDGTLLISDFGRARRVQDNDQIQDGGLGDRRKFAPEQVAFIRQGWHYQGVPEGEKVTSFSGKAADVWAAGLYILELLLNKDVFDEQSAPWLDKVLQWKHANYQTELDKIEMLRESSFRHYLGILRATLRVDPAKRLTSVEASERLNPMKFIEGRAHAFAEVIASYERAQQDNTNRAMEHHFVPLDRQENIHYNYGS